MNKPVGVFDLQVAPTFVLLEESCRLCLAGFVVTVHVFHNFAGYMLHVPLPSKMNSLKLFTPKTVGQTSSRHRMLLRFSGHHPA